MCLLSCFKKSCTDSLMYMKNSMAGWLADIFVLVWLVGFFCLSSVGQLLNHGYEMHLKFRLLELLLILFYMKRMKCRQDTYLHISKVSDENFHSLFHLTIN